MKRIIVYCLILGALCFVPVKGQDVADLEPIQAVWITCEEENIVLETDTGDKGTGATVEAALREMKKRSTGIIYLDTAQFLLVSENVQDAVNEVRPYLKGRVKVCLWDGGKIEDAAKYMQAHKIGVKLRKWNEDVKLPKLPI